MEEIKRKSQGNISEYLDYFKIIGILGPRKVGKTTYARQIMQVFPEKEFIYIDLESSEDNRKLADAETWLKQQKGKTVVIDEIQQRPELFGLLRSVVDKSGEKGQLIILGSASPDIIQKAGQTLAGRIHYVFLNPFSLSEVGIVHVYQHWVRGGYPDSWLAPDDNISLTWRKDYIEGFVYRDLGSMGFGITPATMQRLLLMLGHMHGSILNKAVLANSLGVSSTLVTTYIDILTGSFMVRQLQPYFVNVGKRLVKSPKVYLADSGILHALHYIGNYVDLSGHPIAGMSWEGYVIEEIQKATGQQWQYFFYRTHNGAECDLFCITPSGKKLAIEVKLSNSPTISKGFYQSIEDLKPDAGFVVVPAVSAYKQKDGITVTGLADFLNTVSKF